MQTGPVVKLLPAIVAAALITGCDRGQSEVSTEPPPPIFTTAADGGPGAGATATRAPDESKLRFEEAQDIGIDFHHVTGAKGGLLMPEIFGAGVLMGDFNRDGAIDLLLLNSGDMDSPTMTEEGMHRLYLNDGGGRFADVSEKWALPRRGYGMGGAVGDINGDGWSDVILTGFDGHIGVLLNQAGERFEDVSEKSGIDNSDNWSTSAGVFDADNDGDLDLYICNYIRYGPSERIDCTINNVKVYCTPTLYQGTPDRLYLNNGDGTFVDASVESGLPQVATNGLAVMLGDVDGDRDVDAFIANDLTANLLLVNDGKGKFSEIGTTAGVAYSDQGDETSGMGADISDFDADGHSDIVATAFQAQTTNLYKAHGGNFYRDVSDAAGIGASMRARLSFGIDFFDADNDGDEDLLVANGHIQNIVDSFRADVGYAQQNSLFENVGGGRLIDVSNYAGPALKAVQVSRGLATGDLDNDGRLDFVAGNNNDHPQVAMNRTQPTGGFANFWLEGIKGNRNAIGARIDAKIGERVISQQILGAMSYLSISDMRLHVGTGDAQKIDVLTVYWPGPDGAVQTFTDVAAGKFYRLVEGGELIVYQPGEKTIPPAAAASE